ncbi:MAG: class I SAM-dependent methyltransferase [Bacteroidota bacterium]
MLNRIRRRLGWDGPTDLMTFWTRRVKEMKTHAVLHIDYSGEDMEAITQKHTSIVFPYWAEELNGREKVLLDFGCGAGRFAQSLIELTDAKYIGLDPIADLLAAAPKHQEMNFQLLRSQERWPLVSDSVDLIWIYQVLGGIREKDLASVMEELNRVSQKGAKICLVENTSHQKDSDYWHYRSINEYQDLFQDYQLRHRHSFEEFSETISIFTGQKSI